MNYERLSPFEQHTCLLMWRHLHSEPDRDALIRSLMGYVWKHAHSLSTECVTAGELISDGIEAIFQAIEKYRFEGSTANFATYANTAIYRQIQKSELLKSIFHEPDRAKFPVPSTLSADTPIPDTETLTLGDTLIDETTEKVYIAVDQCIDLQQAIDACLSDKQKFVVMNYYGIDREKPIGFNEIADILEVTPQWVRTIHSVSIQRLRRNFVDNAYI